MGDGDGEGDGTTKVAGVTDAAVAVACGVGNVVLVGAGAGGGFSGCWWWRAEGLFFALFFEDDFVDLDGAVVVVVASSPTKRIKCFVFLAISFLITSRSRSLFAANSRLLSIRDSCHSV